MNSCGKINAWTSRGYSLDLKDLNVSLLIQGQRKKKGLSKGESLLLAALVCASSLPFLSSSSTEEACRHYSQPLTPCSYSSQHPNSVPCLCPYPSLVLHILPPQQSRVQLNFLVAPGKTSLSGARPEKGFNPRCRPWFSCEVSGDKGNFAQPLDDSGALGWERRTGDGQPAVPLCCGFAV